MALKSQNHEELMKLLQVSRETIRSLNIYEALLLENNRKLNLISKSTENIIKTRHILDSAQVIDFIDKNLVKWVRRKKMSLLAYTILTQEQLSKAHELALDGIIMDDPNLNYGV